MATPAKIPQVVDNIIRATNAQDMFFANAISGLKDLFYEFHAFCQNNGVGNISYFWASANSTQYAGNEQTYSAGDTTLSCARGTTVIAITDTLASPGGETGVCFMPKANNTNVKHFLTKWNRAGSTSILIQNKVHSFTTPSDVTDITAMGFDTSVNASCGTTSMIRLIKLSQ